MTSPDLGLLHDMVSAAKTAVQYVDGMTEDEFAADEKTFDAVVRKLEISGEAAGRLSKETRAHFTLPWESMIAQRHIAIHHYRKLRPTRISATVHDDLPVLISAVDAYLGGLP